MESQLDALGGALSKLIQSTNRDLSDDVDRVKMYLEWLIKKTEFISTEKLPLNISDNTIPKKINKFKYDKLPKQERDFLNKYYKESHDCYKLSCEYKFITEEARERIANDILLSRGCVCWVEFGFNIGSEYGGCRPAIVIKNFKNTLLVVPLTTQEKQNREYILEVPFVYDLPKMKRWAMLSNITTISTHRVCFNGSFGRVRGEIIDEIRDRFGKII